ncbi:hypothetical protein INT43_002563, partial [Umbelopsis isabellina]
NIMLNSDDEDLDCPLCMEELDIADRNFRPCPCGYQVCRFCWHHIRENLNSRCPACRREYTEQSVEFQPVSSDEIARIKREKKEKDKEQKDMELANRKHLANMRVIQNNLAYVIGLHPKYAIEEIIRSNDFFGQYGKISKLVINKRPALASTTNTSSLPPSVGIYITYQRKEDAVRCIQAVDGSMIGGRVLRASLGTTKYCTYYLRNIPCPNPACMYLHEPGDDADSISKEELASGKHKMRDSMTSEFGPRSHVFDNRSYSSAENSPISSPAIHHNHRTLSTIESVANISYKTPTARYEHSKQSYFDDQPSPEPTRPALPSTASWARSASGSTTPTTKQHYTQTPDLISDNFGPSLAAAVALAQKANHHGVKTKYEKRKTKKENVPLHLKNSRAFQLQNASVADADESGDENTSEPEQARIIDPLSYFVLGMDANELVVSSPSSQSSEIPLGIEALRPGEITPDDDKEVEQEDTVQTGIAFLKYGIAKFSNQGTVFDPWLEPSLLQHSSPSNATIPISTPVRSTFRSPRREQASLYDRSDRDSPKLASPASNLGMQHSPKRPVVDINPHSAFLLSALQPHNVEQQPVQSTQPNAPPGIDRQPLVNRNSSVPFQSKTSTTMSAFSNLAALNAASTRNLSPSTTKAQSVHAAPSPIPFELSSPNVVRQRSPQQAAQLLSQLTASSKNVGKENVPTSASGDNRGENRRLRVFQGMRGENDGQVSARARADYATESDMKAFFDNHSISPSFSVREMPKLTSNDQTFGAGSDMGLHSIQSSRIEDGPFNTQQPTTSKFSFANSAQSPGLASSTSSPKSSPYGPETPSHMGELRFSPISLETLMAAAPNSKTRVELSPMAYMNNHYNSVPAKNYEQETQQANEEAAQLQNRLRALIQKNKATMFS